MPAARAVSFVFAFCAAAESAQAQKVIACDPFTVWTLDRSKQGLPVRGAPARDARIVGRLVDPEVGMAATALVDAYRNGWFRITSEDWKGNGAKAGWIQAHSLMLDVYDPMLRSRPQADAPVSARLRETLLEARSENPDVTVHGVLECRAAWRRVSTSRGNGWARETCGNPVTTCP